MAKRQEILLTQDVLKLGNMGDIVKVSSGYARNYLFPYELAIPVGVAHKRQIEVLRTNASKMEVEREAKANVQKKSLDGMSIQISARVAHESELFGSIGTKDIVAALAKKGVVVDGKQVHLTDKIKKLGRYKLEVRLHKNVGVEIALEVVNSDPNAMPLDEAIAAAATPAVVPAAAAAAASSTEAPAPKKASKVKNLGKAPESASPAPAKK